MIRELPSGEIGIVEPIMPADPSSGWQVVYWGSMDDFLADLHADSRDLAAASVSGFDTAAEALAELNRED